jgi:hypothetical protein
MRFKASTKATRDSLASLSNRLLRVSGLVIM